MNIFTNCVSLIQSLYGRKVYSCRGMQLRIAELQHVQELVAILLVAALVPWMTGKKTELLGEEPPLRQSVDQTQCSGRHVQSIAEENVWVKAEKVTVGRTEHNAGCMTAYLSVSSIVFSQVVVNVKEFLDVGNRLNAVLMSVIDERFLSDFDSLQKSKWPFVTVMLHLSLSVCVTFWVKSVAAHVAKFLVWCIVQHHVIRKFDFLLNAFALSRWMTSSPWCLSRQATRH